MIDWDEENGDKERAELNKLKCEAQAEGCLEHKAPHFAPRDGICWHCSEFIFKNKTVEQSRSPVTGCPFCNWSYCE